MKIKTPYSLALLMLTASFASAQSITRCGGPTNALYINWPTFQFDVCHTGYNPYENRLNVDNVQNLVVAWQYTLSGSSSYPSSPAIVNSSVYFAANDGYVYALNATTGALIWRYSTGWSPLFSLAVVNGVVYIGANTKVLALKADTGVPLWQQTVGRNIKSSPAVVNGLLYIGAQAQGAGYNVVALNATTGAPVWTYLVSGEIASSPAVVNGLVYINSGGSLYALNAVTGALLWHYDQNIFLQSSPAVFHGVAYSGGDAVYALNAVTGSVIWTYSPNPAIQGTSSAAVANGVLYIVASFFDNDSNTFYSDLLALDASSGQLIWSAPVAGQISTFSPTVANGVVYVSGTNGGGLFMFNAATGQELGFTQGGEAAMDSPPVVNGVLFTGCSHNPVESLCAYSLPGQ